MEYLLANSCLHSLLKTLNLGGDHLLYFLQMERMRKSFDTIWETVDHGRLSIVGKCQVAVWLEVASRPWARLN